MVIPVLVGFFQVLTHRGLTFADSTNRAFGTFGHPNVMAFYLVLGISYFILIWPLLQTRVPNRWPIITALVLALLLTQTRGAWAGLLVSLGVIGFIRFRRLFAGGVFAVAMLIAILPTVNSITTDVFGVNLQTVPGVKEIVARQANQSSYQWRIDVWKDMGRRIQERPLFGFGLGAFPTVRSLQVFDFFQGIGAHNDYLRLVIELGLIGSLAYAALLISIFVFLGRLYKSLQAHPLSLPVLGLIGFSAAFVVMSAFDNLLQSTPVMWAYMVLLGAVLNLAPRALPRRK
jgi:O-antigen ligase